MNLSENIRLIRDKITEVAVGCGRKPEEILLVAVTKTVGVDLIQMAIDAGIQDIGENRVQEAKAKFGEVNRKVNWHLIGHLQTNKVKHAVEIFDLIQSVDRIEVAQEIQKRAVAINKKQRILVQVNTSDEESKSGCQPEEADNLVKSISVLPNIQIEGLMTIGPLTNDSDKIRSSFQTLKKIFNRLSNMKLPNVIMKDLSIK